MTLVTTKPVGPIVNPGGPVDTLPLTVIDETSSTVTLGWTPVPGCVGYALYLGSGTRPVSQSWDPAKNTWKVAKHSTITIRIVALTAGPSGTYNP